MSGEQVKPLAYGTYFGKAVIHWAIRDITWPQFCRLLDKPAANKTDALSYLPGLIQPGPGKKCKCTKFLHRTKQNVVSRWAVTLDADYCGNAGSAMLSALKRMNVAAAAHTTWSSTEDDERYRVIIPLSRDVEPLEYGPIARWLMRELGEGFFDATCDQASRLMYLPAAPDGGDTFWRGVMRGDWLDADLILDLAGGPDVEVVREYEDLGFDQLLCQMVAMPWWPQLRGLCNKVGNCEEGNRDSLLLWALKAAKDADMDLDFAGKALALAGMASGLEEDVCQEKVARILG